MSSSNDLANSSLLFTLNIIATSLSLLGSAWMSSFYVRLKGTKSAALRFILAISLADFFYSLSNLMSAFDNQEDMAFCKLEGFIREFSIITSLFLASFTGILCFKDSKYGYSFDKTGFFKKAALCSVLISFCLSIS